MSNENNFLVTEDAIKHIQTILKENQVFRISVEPGGCNGFEYKFSIENYDKDYAKFYNFCHKDIPIVIIDNISLSLMKNSVLDYEKELMYEKFVIKNPNSKSNCSCGSSFAT
jgi:iron-sulfur cluster insertion protein